MAKFKIQKGLSDADMLKNFKDTENFEDTMLDMERAAKKPVVHQSPKQKEDAFYREFLTEKVETMIGKMLLDIKMEYFKEGEGAFSIQVKRDGKNIVLETAPKKVKPEKWHFEKVKNKREPVHKWTGSFAYLCNCYRGLYYR